MRKDITSQHRCQFLRSFRLLFAFSSRDGRGGSTPSFRRRRAWPRTAATNLWCSISSSRLPSSSLSRCLSYQKLQIFVFTFKYLYLHSNICIYIQIFVFTYKYLYLHTNICIYIQVFVFTYKYLYLHTNICNLRILLFVTFN
jgi:hypothetical protein